MRHVLWIGGGSRAGKSTVSKKIADEFGFLLYESDEQFFRHAERATKERAPSLWYQHQLIKNGQLNAWFATLNAREMAQGGRDTGAEILPMVIDDLLALPADRRIVVDLVGTHAEGLVQVAGMNSIVFLVATDAFQRKELDGSGKNYIEGQRLFSEYFRSEAKRLGIPMIVTGGNLTIEESYSAVCRHFCLTS